jgi:hypothetical protein
MNVRLRLVYMGVTASTLLTGKYFCVSLFQMTTWIRLKEVLTRSSKILVNSSILSAIQIYFSLVTSVIVACVGKKNSGTNC